ncbi:PREDICTED: integrin beta-1-binding protein 1-like [Poecilia mexicana]|uniref:integrin beta-1-binding protein 1-like n=1 Tax=Poecilia mexicana TaxID=48701 RepID=UPI00072E27EE|nr:PREDICTED: integrin beta-1-binding protein 1-like [Poecilia mexicana]
MDGKHPVSLKPHVAKQTCYIWCKNGISCISSQQDGKLPFVPGDEEMVLGVSKHGVKVASVDQCDVLHRHPLYLIVRMLCYDDGLGAGKNLLALKTTDTKQQQCSIWVYQCSSSEQAQNICKVLSASFDCALSSNKP